MASWLVGFEIFRGRDIVGFGALLGRDIFAFFAFMQRRFVMGVLLFPPSVCWGGMETWEERFIFFVLGILKAWLVTVVFSLAGAGGFTQLNLVWGGCLADCGNENDGGCE